MSGLLPPPTTSSAVGAVPSPYGLAAVAVASSHDPAATASASEQTQQRHHGTLTDRLYNAELARRSVARAALHLGIDAIEGQALDCLGDALLEYLDRFGANLAALAEASHRTSAHVNVLDALYAAERTTSTSAAVDCALPRENDGGIGAGAEGTPAAVTSAGSAGHSVSSGGGGGTGNDMAAAAAAAAANAGNAPRVQPPTDPRSWESLAVFLFGPHWATIQLPGDDVEPKLVKEYEDKMRKEGKLYVPVSSSSGGGSSKAASGSGGGAAAAAAGASTPKSNNLGGSASKGRRPSTSVDTVNSILAEAAKLAAKSASASRSATPVAGNATPTNSTAAAAAAADGAASTGSAASDGDADRTAAAPTPTPTRGATTAADAAQGEASGTPKSVGSPRKGKQLPQTAMMPAKKDDKEEATTLGMSSTSSAGGSNPTNAVNVPTPGKTAGPGGKALIPKTPATATALASASTGKSVETLGCASKSGGGVDGTSSAAVGGVNRVNIAVGIGGKAVPQSAAGEGENDADASDNVVQTAAIGWDAPFPDEIPPYPLLASHSHRADGRDTSKGPANPHKLPFGVVMGLHLAHLVGAEEACRIDYGPHGPRKPHVHETGKSMAAVNREKDEEKRKKKEKQKEKELEEKEKKGRSKIDEGIFNMAAQLAQEQAARAEAKEKTMLEDMPERVFAPAVITASYWGSVSAPSQKGTTAESSDADKMDIDSPETKPTATKTDDDDKSKKRTRFEYDTGGENKSAKRARTDSAAGGILQNGGSGSQGLKSSSMAPGSAPNRRRPGYVPGFLPPFPPPRTYADGAGGSGNAEQAVAELLRSGGAIAGSSRVGTTRGDDGDAFGRSYGVRKSLLGLGNEKTIDSSPWGAPVSSSGALLDTLTVPAGRSVASRARMDSAQAAAAAAKGRKSPAVAGSAAAAVSIEPLSRASASRVSKILEGSLDAN